MDDITARRALQVAYIRQHNERVRAANRNSDALCNPAPVVFDPRKPWPACTTCSGTEGSK